MSNEVIHDAASSRYVINVDGSEAGFAAYERSGDVLDFNHTVVHSDFQGQGLSKPLIKFSLDDVASNNLRIIATCSAVARFVEKNPEYQDLIAQ